jgi:hypothetical protein
VRVYAASSCTRLRMPGSKRGDGRPGSLTGLSPAASPPLECFADEAAVL